MGDYWLDIDSDQGIIKKSINETNNRHKKCDALVPFVTKTGQHTSYYDNFTGVIGAFSRLLSNMKPKLVLNEKSLETFHNEVKNRVDGCSDDQLDRLFEIIDSLYFEQGKILPVNVKSLSYIESNTSQEQVAEFMYDLFISPNGLNDVYKQMESTEESNVLDRLVFDSLGGEASSTKTKVKSECFLPYVQEVFALDFRALTTNADIYKKNIFRFLAYYYMFYVCQLAVKLSKFEKGCRDEIEEIYLTLNWEVVSKSRLGYKYGWNYVKDRLSHMFSHSIIMEFLSYNIDERLFDYIAIYDRFYNAVDDQNVSLEIKRLNELYRSWIGSRVDFSGCLHDESKECSCLTMNEIKRLYESIEYFFQKGQNTSHYNGFNAKFIDFVNHNFGKRRGTLGYTVGVNENDIIMFTQIILIEHGGKILITKLYEEFEKRGLRFDRDSKKRITDLFEKMNLLDKKSDCGEAQYVKSIL